MQKITFQDTEVVKAPYVEINGIEYEVESEYEGGTDLDAETFNQMQDNIEEAINNIPIYDDTEMKTGWYEMPITATLAYSSWDNTNKIGVLTTNVDLTEVLGIGTKLKFYNVTGYKYAIIIAITSSTITIYLGNQTLNDGAIEFLKYAITETPIDYPSYMSSLENLYLPVEIPVGMYHNKILYRRMIEGNRSGSQETTINYSDWNVDEFKIILAQNYSNNNQYYYGAPYYANAGDQYRVYTNLVDKNIIINCGSDFPGQSGRYVCMAEYTKTTD